MLPKVESRPEFAQDHESGLRSDRGPVVLCDFSKLRFRKSPYDFLNLYGRFCPYNPPYNPGHDTLQSKMRVEIFTLYRATSRKPDREISFRTHFWWQWVNKNDPSLISERTVWSSILLSAHGHQFLLRSFTLFATTFPEIWSTGISIQKYVNGKLLRRKLTENNNKYRVYQPDLQPDSVSWRYSGTKC